MRTAAVGLAMAAIVALAAGYAFSPRPTPPLAPTRLAVDQMQLNTITRSAAGLVAGGELGHIIVSSDQGKDWKPAKLSNDREALINQIVFDEGGKTGMAVGHEGWILRSDDGGLNWREVAFDKDNGEPLMSIAHLPSGPWITVGAFGRALRSLDDGKSWERIDFGAAGVEDKHLNRIAGSADGTQWVIVGERGLVLLSDGEGREWRAVAPFYDGSFYNATAQGADGWLVYGMRGNVWRSTDRGANWHKSDVPAPVSFFDAARAPDGRLLLVGQGGIVATSSDDGEHFSIRRVGRRAALTDIVLRPDGSALITSDAGLETIAASALAAAASTPSSSKAAE